MSVAFEKTLCISLGCKLQWRPKVLGTRLENTFCFKISYKRPIFTNESGYKQPAPPPSCNVGKIKIVRQHVVMFTKRRKFTNVWRRGGERVNSKYQVSWPKSFDLHCSSSLIMRIWIWSVVSVCIYLYIYLFIYVIFICFQGVVLIMLICSSSIVWYRQKQLDSVLYQKLQKQVESDTV